MFGRRCRTIPTGPRRILLGLVCGLAWLAPVLAAAADGRITGTVTLSDGSPAVGARVTVVELNESRFVDDGGAYSFDGVPHGAYHVQAVLAGLGSAVKETDVTGETRVDLRLEFSVHREQITVTATRGGIGTAEVVQPVSVIDAAELDRKMQATVGETLAAEPGVSSTYFGPGSSRPVIRGQSGGRIRILEGGLGVGDASSTSPDHAVATDLLGATQVEILRGPSTLLYGSTAVGGVVNVLDRRVPDFVPRKPVTGSLSLRLGSAADETAGALSLDGGGGQFAWHADALARNTGDVEIPGRAVLGDPGSPAGTLPNSDLESEGGTLGASWVGRRGFIGVSARALDTNYGIPAELEPDGGSGGAAGDGVRIDLEQRRFDLRGALDLDLGAIDRVVVSAGLTDYEHRELEDGAVGTTFLNDSREARIELLHGSGGPRSGVFGVQVTSRDFEAIGDEAFVPPSTTDTLAAFAVQEFDKERVRYELGARLEAQDVEAPGSGLPARDFDALSASAGLLWRLRDDLGLGVSLTHATRAPSAEELYSDGPHLATLCFERGDASLDEETSSGLDVTLRRRGGRSSGEATVFLTRYDDYILETLTGELEDGLSVCQFSQRDTEFRGFELSGAVHLVKRENVHLDLELLADAVRAEFRSDGAPLPRIPAARAGVGLTYQGTGWEASVMARRVFEQDRTGPFETRTDGYTTLDASVGYRAARRGVVHHVLLRASNITDEEARNHASRLKDLVPLPGFDASLVYRLDF